MGLYTKTGDSGKTGLLDGKRVYKSDTRIEAYGTVDELVAAIALARSFNFRKDISDILKKIEEDLFLLAAELAAEKADMLKDKITQEHIEWLETKIDQIMSKSSLKNDFIVPGPYKSSASIHVARTIARRAERQAVKLDLEISVRKEVLIYLNRLSDLLFAISKFQEEEETIKQAMERVKTNFCQKAGSLQNITLDVALAIIKAAEAKAVEIGVPMVISIVDKGGYLIALHRMDGAIFASIEISINKAYTSAAFRMPTSALSTLAIPESELYGINTQSDGRYVTFGGGIPICCGNEVIGAIGVRGGTVREDETVANAGLKILTEGS
ncbi:MAG: cob(I)yrinic acid a,c-diamide adenosyltransferase [Thermoanaerobacteraceae bacterium]|nr:cob(I)yrinic acid a,c-diamide adenosyltransferase [Thermoanaerobacteraceae bacterium]